MANLFTSALSGMNAAQLGLATAEHNIANASTPGFTRQQIVSSSRIGQSTGAGFIGQGVDVSAVKRIYDQFLTSQVLQEQNQASYLTAYSTAMKQIDNLVADPAAGASPAMQSFFDAMNGVSNNPQSVPARQTLLGGAQFVVNRFQAIDQRLTDITNGNTAQITSSVSTINTYAQQIATLNGNIKRSIANGVGKQPNDLLDQRDQLISKLNLEIKTSVVQQPDGTVGVFVGNGQAMVIDEQAMKLQTVQSSSDPSKVDIAYVNNGTSIPMQQSSLQGGNLGAYLAFRDQSLEPARNALGRVAMGLAASINQQNQLGQDLNGQAGAALFNMALPRVDRSSSNTGTASVSATIADVSSLTTSDYQLSFNGTNYSMTRMSDNVVTNLGNPALPATFTVDGFTATLTAGAKAGDSFLIRPTANGARDIALATNDPAKIAAALPLRAAASISATNTSSIKTVASGAITSATVTGAGTTASTATFTVDGKTLFTNSIAAGATGTLISAGQLDTAWTAFAAANPGYTLTGTFAAGTAQITKTGGASITLAETTTLGTGAVAGTSFSAAGAGFMGTTLGKVAGMTVSTPTNANLTAPVTITFTAANTYTVTGAVPAVVGPQTYTAPTISYNGWTMQLNNGAQNAPVAGDVFNVGANSGAAKVSSGALNLNPVSINFTSATAYNVVEMRGTPPAAVTLGSGLIPPAVGGSNTVSYNGWTAQIAGVPNAGDVFNVTKGSNAGSMLVAPAAANAGAGTISGGTLSVQPFTITFNNPATSYTVSGATPAVAGAVPYTAGQDISYNGWTMQVTGTPAAGDVFSFATNSNALADNRNALMLASVQNQNLLANGTASLQGGYSQLVGQVGAKTNELAVTSLAQNNMVSQTVMSQQAVSGVNLDEEAANLMSYQKAYQAAAKAMQIANTMFDSVLALGK